MKKLISVTLCLCCVCSLFAQEKKLTQMIILGGNYVAETQSKQFNHNYNLVVASLYFNGKLNPYMDFQIKFDCANTPQLADANITLKLNKYFNVCAGQIKVPYTIQANLIPSTIDGGYDAVILKLAGNNDVCGVGTKMRDLGISISGSAIEREFNGKKFDLINYSFGILNGYDLNKKDNDNKKNFAAKIDIFPYNEILDLSASLYKGTFTKDQIKDGLRDRFAIGTKYSGHRLSLLSEYIWGKTGTLALDNNGKNYFLSRGGYLSIGYYFYFKPLTKNGAKQSLMPMIKYDYFRENVIMDDFVGTSCIGLRYKPFEDVNVDAYYRIQTNHSTSNIKNSITLGCTVKF